MCQSACKDYVYFGLEDGENKKNNGTGGKCSCENDLNEIEEGGRKDCGADGYGKKLCPMVYEHAPYPFMEVVSQTNGTALSASANSTLLGVFKIGEETPRFDYGPHAPDYTKTTCLEDCSFEYFNFMALVNYAGMKGICMCDNALTQDGSVEQIHGATSCEGKENCAEVYSLIHTTTVDTFYMEESADYQYLNVSYKDTGTRALRYGPHKYGFTAQACRDACPDYKYFALQAGDGTTGWCSCDNDWDHITMYGPGDCPKTGGGLCNALYESIPEFVEEEWTFVSGDASHPCELMERDGDIYHYKCYYEHNGEYMV